MFNKNVFTQKDPIADLVKPMLEAQAKAKMEELKGNQAVLDKNKNNKLDSQDFKILRGEKKVNEEEKVEESSPFDWKKPREPEVKGGAGVKKGRAYGGAAQKSKPEQETDDDKKKTQKEEVEQVDERSLTSGEKAEMEKNVKGMKKNLAGFKARYGERAKSVIYATATKQAKKD